VSQEKPLPPMPTLRGKDHELIVGIFVVLGVAAILTALFTLTDASLFRGRYEITTIVPNAGGIRKGDPVQMRGVNIGRIKSFVIDRETVAVRLEIEGEYKIPKDSRCELKSAGLLGGMAADVVPGSSPEFLRGGDTIPGSIGTGVFDKVNELSGDAEKALDRVQALLSETTVKSVEASSVELNRLLKQLQEVTAEQRKELLVATRSLRKSAEGLEKATAGPELEHTIKQMDSITRKLDVVTASLDRSAKSADIVLGRLERGEGLLGRMSKEDTLYVNANEAVANLNKAVTEITKLTQDIRREPKRYLKISVF
jgi:phospholipid/cholesterol/gamma-HCH transport system substrate-binding protein